MNTQVNLMNQADHLEVAEKLSLAYTNRDITALREVYHEGAEIWHNFDDLSQGLEENFVRLKAFLDVFSNMTFKNIRRFATEKGFVQQHDLAGTHINGEPLNSCPACFVVTVEAGKVTRLDEYLDLTPIAAWLAAN